MSEVNPEEIRRYAFDFSQYPNEHAEGPFHVSSQVEVREGIYAGVRGVVTKVLVDEEYGLVFRVAADNGEHRDFTQDCLTHYDPSTGQPDV
jgi:hypothetical protein